MDAKIYSSHILAQIISFFITSAIFQDFLTGIKYHNIFTNFKKQHFSDKSGLTIKNICSIILLLKAFKLVFVRVDMRRLEKDFERARKNEQTPERHGYNPPTNEQEDLLPEYCDYQDEGCSLSPTCLNCTFEACVYDLPWGRMRQAKVLRDKEIMRLFAGENKTPEEIAIQLKISLRTVRRALAELKQ
jgi:hypothetical protein